MSKLHIRADDRAGEWPVDGETGLTDGWFAGYARGRAAEQADILMWLSYRPVYRCVAQAIERGDHRKCGPVADTNDNGGE